MRIILINCLFLLVSIIALGQKSLETNKNKAVAVRFSSENGVVRLRWAPVNTGIWSIGKSKGYIIEKVTLYENGKSFLPPKEEILTKSPILPATQDIWIRKMDEIDEVAIIGQAFYGESFQLNAKKSTKKMVSILDESVEINQRFVFSLFAADMNFEAATIAGWGYTDNSVLPDGIYKYRVYPYNGDSLSKAEISVDMSNSFGLPSPFGVYAQFDENLAEISWELSFTEDVYSAYNIERSTDSINFKRVNSIPFVITEKLLEEKKINRGVFSDSIPNDIMFYYRISGIDCFGDEGPYSMVVKGKAFRRLKCVPDLKSYMYKSNDIVTITWEFDKEQEDLITGFDVLRSENIDGPYEIIIDNISPKQRETDIEMLPSNYVIVRALGIKSDYTASGTQFIDKQDFTPPLPPQKPAGEIDSMGIVSLWWPANKEKNIKGYHVYYSRFKNEEFVQLTYKPIADTVFTDTISLNTLVENINYRIRAVNNRNGHSEPSETLVLQLPDTIKPVSPYFLNYKVNSDSVCLNWVNSSSRDVIMHQLFRKTVAGEEWSLITSYDSTKISKYTDHNLNEREQYIYILKAFDDDSLESEPSNPLNVWVSPYITAPQIEDFSATLNRKDLKINLKWKKNETVAGFQIYKQIGEYPPFLFEFLEPGENKFVDKKIKPFTNYTYKIRSKGKNGLYSPFSEIKVDW